jgi:hypothetical protein
MPAPTSSMLVSQRERNLINWLRAQMDEFVTPPQRWSATISGEGLRIQGSFSKNHRVESDEAGRVLVDGVPMRC